MTSGLAVGFLSVAHPHSDADADILADRVDVDLAGVVDGDAERGRAFADRHDTEYVADGDALLESVDAALICAPNADHRAWFERAAAAGVDVLCEKPLATSVADARAMVDRWRDSGVAAGVAMPLRFCDPALRTKAAIDAGDVGRLRSISGTNRGQFPGGWFADPEAAGGGAVTDHTVHIVDLVQYLTGQDIAEVYAETATRFRDVPVEDVNVLSMELADGTPFLLDGSWSKPDAWHTWGDATLELTGTESTVALDHTDQSLVHTVDPDSGESDSDGAGDAGESSESGESDGAERERDPGVRTAFYGTDANAALLEDFVTSAREGTDPEITPDEGLRAVAVVAAAYESAETGAPVDVTY